MRRLALLLAALTISSAPLAGQVGRSASPTQGRSLQPFRSEGELRTYLVELLGPPRVAAPEAAPPAPPSAPAPNATPAPPPSVPCAAPAPLARTFRRGLDTTGTAPASRSAVVTGSVFGGPNALFGANVTVEALHISVGTGEDGRFAFEMPAGRIASGASMIVRARSFGYLPRTVTITPLPGDSIDVHFVHCQDVNRLSQVVVTGAESGASSLGASITNVQHAGVDEGGIVKRHGGHLVVLRHGRLYTIAVVGDQLRPVASVDAFPRGVDGTDAWYDEMLLHEDKVVVVGYNYGLDATELSLFRLDRRGGLRHLSTHHLRTDDYYSSRNYAARLVDGKLVLYAARRLERGEEDPLDALPMARRWEGQLERGSFRRITSPTRVHRVAGYLPRAGGVAFHSVTTCQLRDTGLDCASDVVIGPAERVFYVSPKAVYLWSAGRGPVARTERQRATGMLYRLPLDHSAPTAIGVHGSPIDQFSFREDDDGMLNVVVESAGNGDAMWNAESPVRALSLLRIRTSELGDGARTAAMAAYRGLPSPGAGGMFRQRFVGNHLLYATSGHRLSLPGDHEVIVAEVAGPTVTRIRLGHGTDRIEAMGRHAVVVGSGGGSLHVTGIRLGSAPAPAQSFALEGAREGEERSHGFFYRDDGETGIIGLPVRGAASHRYASLQDASAAVLMIRNTGREFRQLGYLAATEESSNDDGCESSCADWYGNSRPIFLDRRVFALLGYELVEGTETPYGIHERRRVDFRKR